MSIWSLTYQQSVFKRYRKEKFFLQIFTYKMAAKSTGIDVEQNYVTVTLWIYRVGQKSKLLILSKYVNKTEKIRGMWTNKYSYREHEEYFIFSLAVLICSHSSYFHVKYLTSHLFYV